MLPPMKSLLLLLLLLAAPSAEAAPAATHAPVATNWLHLPGRALVLDLRHQDMNLNCRSEAGEIVQSVIQELNLANYTVFLSRYYVQAERDYYRAHTTNEAPAATARAVLACLESSLARGDFDWPCLREAARAAPDSLAVIRNFPWLHTVRDPRKLRLASAEAASLPVLQLDIVWDGRVSRGTAALNAPRWGGISLGEDRVYQGVGHIWNIAATLRLRQGDRVIFEEEYPAEEWQKLYINNTGLPHYRTNQRILEDLQAGLKPPAAPLNKKKKR